VQFVTTIDQPFVIMVPAFALLIYTLLCLMCSSQTVACAFDKDMEDYVHVRLNGFPWQTTQQKCSALAGQTLPPNELKDPAGTLVFTSSRGT
jgi:hypothetical protein